MQLNDTKNILILVLCITLGGALTALVFNSQKKSDKGKTEKIEKQEKPNDNPVVDSEKRDNQEELNQPEKEEEVLPEEILTQEELYDVYQTYLSAWNQKDYYVQASLLAPDFSYHDDKESGSKADYLQKKRKLFDKYPWISVEASDEKIQVNKNTGSVTYYQHYDSPNYESWGNNTFFFRKKNGEALIYKEIFRPIRRASK
jgi:hypothetical protein